MVVYVCCIISRMVTHPQIGLLIKALMKVISSTYGATCQSVLSFRNIEEPEEIMRAGQH